MPRVSPLVDLAPFDVETLEGDPSTIYAVTPDLRIVYVNAAWARFAEENGARWGTGQWGLGSSILDTVPDVLRPFHEGLFARVASGSRVVEHDYDCSSPTIARLFRMRVLRCASGALLVVHSLLREAPRPETALPPLEELYRRSGILLQCCHCRRVQRAGDESVWDWVPAFAVRTQPRTSHGLCRLCNDYYYADEP